MKKNKRLFPCVVSTEDIVSFKRVWAMPNGRTFSIPPIKTFVENALFNGAYVVDPFANECKYGTITNDLNPEYNTTYCMDALEFLKLLPGDSADVVLYDPPYSITQATTLYKSYGKEKLKVSVNNMKYWALCKDNIARIVKRGGIVLSFGWNTNGCGKNRGFVMTEILDVYHGGSKNDTLCCKEVKL